MDSTVEKYVKYIHQLNHIGIALSAEKNHGKLLEKILQSAIDIVNADGGTLYLYKPDNTLNFEILINKSLNLKTINGNEGLSSPIALYNSDLSVNEKNIAAQCFIQNKIIHIPDAYAYEKYDFEDMRASDKKLGYRSISFLVIPLRNHEDKIVGILQLINAVDDSTKKVIAFTAEKISLAESLASQAAITLTQQELIQAQKNLFEALIQLIAQTIDDKSKYTSKHCTRVPVLTEMIANAAEEEKTGYFKNFHLTQEQREELHIAAWLHDCGKIVTPVHIVDKATKLETISDRIEVIDLRLEVIMRDLKISFLELKTSRADYEKKLKVLNDARIFIRKINLGAEYLAENDKQMVTKLAKLNYEINQKKYELLTSDDIKNLLVSRGTLNDDDRNIINQHVTLTKRMLSLLPYPDHLKNVPEIAGSHHEAMNGKGYPDGLKGDEISVQTRMLAIADIFEALTSGDRPYKQAKTLSETLKIMTKMKDDDLIDYHLFDLFVKHKIYLEYAKKYLHPNQIDL